MNYSINKEANFLVQELKKESNKLGLKVYKGPLNSEIISDVIRIIIFGLLLFWHLPRLLSDDGMAQ